MTPPSPSLKTPLSLDQKARAKETIQKEFTWVAEPRRPLIVIPHELTGSTGESFLKEMLPGLLALDVSLLIRGRGSASIGTLLTSLHQKYPQHIAIFADKEDALLRMIRGADIALFCTSPDSSKELPLCLQNGAIPIALESTLSLSNYDPVQESGNAFTFQKMNPWHAFVAIVRACETFKLPFDWRTIQKHCIETIV